MCPLVVIPSFYHLEIQVSLLFDYLVSHYVVLVCICLPCLGPWAHCCFSIQIASFTCSTNGHRHLPYQSRCGCSRSPYFPAAIGGFKARYVLGFLYRRSSVVSRPGKGLLRLCRLCHDIRLPGSLRIYVHFGRYLAESIRSSWCSYPAIHHQ